MILRRLMVLAATSFIFTLPAFSQPGAPGGVQGGPAGDMHSPAGGGGGFDKLQGKYALSTDQQKQLQDLSTELFGQLREKMPSLHAKRVAILQALTEPKVDVDKLQSLQTGLNTATNAMADAVLQNQIKQMQVLTPEQRQQMRPPENEMKMPMPDPGK